MCFSLANRPPDPWTFRLHHHPISLTMSDYNRPFPDNGADIKPAFTRFREWYEFYFETHPDSDFRVPAPRVGLRWDSETENKARLVVYPEVGKLTLGNLYWLISGAEGFLQANEWMELTFIAKNLDGETLGSGALYYVRALRPSSNEPNVE